MTKQIVCPTKLLHPLAKAPTRGSEFAAGHDIYCVGGLTGVDESKWDANQQRAWRDMESRGYVTLDPGQGFLFRTGFSQAIQPGHACLLWDRSGMGGIKMVARLAGVIDEDYRGEWFVRLINLSQVPHVITVGDKIVQGVYQERIAAEFPVVTELPPTVRGDGGFGSTDKPK